MNEFNKRWQMLAQKARSLAEEALPELPFGFAARVIAGSRETLVESWDEMLSALGLRALLVMASVCLITGGLAYSEWYPAGIERPALEQTLTNELPWP